MPVLPPQALSKTVFWDSNDVLNFARILVNDVQGGLTGQDLSDDRPYTWPLLNFCYAKLQNWMEDSNVEATTYAEAVIGPLVPNPNASADPNSYVRLGYDGYWDGGADDTDQKFKLPDDCLMPLEIWEKPTSYTNGAFLPMRQVLGGLPARSGAYNFRYWEWRWDSNHVALFLPGAIQSNLLRIRYIPALPMLIQPAAGQPYPQIPLVRAGEALAYMVAAEFAEIRNAPNAPMLRRKADEQLEIISNKSAKRENQVDQRRRGYGFGRRRRLWY